MPEEYFVQTPKHVLKTYFRAITALTFPIQEGNGEKRAVTAQCLSYVKTHHHRVFKEAAKDPQKAYASDQKLEGNYEFFTGLLETHKDRVDGDAVMKEADAVATKRAQAWFVDFGG